MPRHIVVLFDQPEGQALLQKHCRRLKVKTADLRQLVEIVIEKNNMERRRGLWDAFDEVIDMMDGEG